MKTRIRKITLMRILSYFNHRLNIVDIIRQELKKKTEDGSYIALRQPKNCPNCKTIFHPKKSIIDHCSPRCRTIARRVVDRPSNEILKGLIEAHGYTGTGRIYGVSDNAIRKWLKNAM